MRIYPAVHYAMGGLWVDYDLQSTIPGLFVIGEANFSDHGANRLGASALMQGLADGYFVLPNTINDYLARWSVRRRRRDHPAAQDRRLRSRSALNKLLAINGERTVDSFHKELGRSCGSTAAWPAPPEGLMKALAHRSRTQGRVLERRQGHRRQRGLQPDARACRPRGRLLRARRADVHRRAAPRRVRRRPLPRGEPDRRRRGVARRREVRARRGLGFGGDTPVLHKEPLEFEYIEMKQRSYK